MPLEDADCFHLQYLALSASGDVWGSHGIMGDLHICGGNIKAGGFIEVLEEHMKQTRSFSHYAGITAT